MARDYYGLLNLSQGASDQEIKKAYRKLAREFHPDINPDPGSQEKFREITMAYETLTDPQKKAIIDSGGDPNDAQGFGGFNFSGGLGDMFEAFFGGGGSQSRGPKGRVRPGEDSLVRVELTLEECASGITKEIKVDTSILCDKCHGAGSEDGSKPVTCEVCKGQGEIQSLQRSILGQIMTSRPCSNCHAAGVVIKNPCTKCRGEGRTLARRDIPVKFPAGVGKGMQVRLTGQGEVGFGGGAAGDLYVEVLEKSHKLFIRDGDDLHLLTRIPVVDAILGSSFDIESILDETVTIDVPHGTSAGDTTKLNNFGMPRVNSKHRGSLIVHYDLDIPKKLDPKHRELLLKMKTERKEEISFGEEAIKPHGEGFFSKLKNTFTHR